MIKQVLVTILFCSADEGIKNQRSFSDSHNEIKPRLLGMLNLMYSLWNSSWMFVLIFFWTRFHTHSISINQNATQNVNGNLMAIAEANQIET